MGDKQPVSVLVVVHTSNLHVLLLERADFPDHWQSVTGSRDEDEALADTARRPGLGRALRPSMDAPDLYLIEDENWPEYTLVLRNERRP